MWSCSSSGWRSVFVLVKVKVVVHTDTGRGRYVSCAEQMNCGFYFRMSSIAEDVVTNAKERTMHMDRILART